MFETEEQFQMLACLVEAKEIHIGHMVKSKTRSSSKVTKDSCFLRLPQGKRPVPTEPVACTAHGTAPQRAKSHQLFGKQNRMLTGLGKPDALLLL